MIRILLVILMFTMAGVGYAEQYFIRDDGGRPIINDVGECDGTVDAPKSEDGHCAYNYIYQERSADPDSDDEIVISKGRFAISVQPPQIWITMKEFSANSKKWTDLYLKGRQINITESNGRVWELKLKY